MVDVTAATFLPDSLVITLKPVMTALTDPGEIKGFDKHDIGFFFHEWIHFLHNVSTLHGLTAFENAVAMWSDFRFTCDAETYSSGSAVLPSEFSFDIRQRMSYWVASRLPSRTDFPNGPLNELRLLSAHPKSTPLPDSELSVTTMECFVAADEQSQDHCTVVVGTYEIIESVAWMLEDRLNTALGVIKRMADLIRSLLIAVRAFEVNPRPSNPTRASKP
ncbi:hypothetical protein OKW40_003673 [Paraburkholderia sp. RAU6.4a]|uniref:hypothetical protein n=1 Tax=Paraburkholderia sp. RAU6.4a TaxID=2991067 RepID=UPI003D2113C0